MELRAGFEPTKRSPPLRYGEPLMEPPYVAFSGQSRLAGHMNEVDDIEGEIERFRDFLRLKKNLSKKVVNGHCNTIKRFLYSYPGILSPKTVEGYLKGNKDRWSTKTYANHLGSLKRFIRDFRGLDYVEDYDFPSIALNPVIVPSKEDIGTFFDAMPETMYTATRAGWSGSPAHYP